VYNTTQDLDIRPKVIAATSDNTSNNGALIPILHKHLLKNYDDEVDKEFLNVRTVMKFQGAKSHIYCLAHALNLIAQDILQELKSGTMKQAHDNEDDVEQAGLVAKL